MAGFLRRSARIGGLSALLLCAPAAGVAQVAHLQTGTAPAVPRSPSPGTFNDLQAVQALSPTNAWAVGFYCKSCTQFGVSDHTLILHWNGTSWAKIPSPNPGTTNDLFGISGDSATDAWAVGYYCPASGCSTGQLPLLLHWNGTAWSRTPSPALPAGGPLNSVAAVSPTDAWAVGYTGVGKTEILRWNGTAWSQVPSPSPNPANFNFLGGVSADSATDAWAVGNYCATGCSGTSQIYHTLILHWNGATWSKVRSPSPGPSYNILQAVSVVSSNAAFASGYFSNYTSLILHWNGTSWSRAKAPNAFGSLWGISASSATDAWAVGGIPFLHWNGTKWVKVAIPGSYGYFGVSADSATDAWAVGSACDHSSCSTSDTLTIHWNGTKWSLR